MIVPIHTTSTVHVPYDAGGKPDGWDKLSQLQKDWALDESRSCRAPVWAVMERIPNDQAILVELQHHRRVGWVIGTICVLAVLALATVMVLSISRYDCGYRYYGSDTHWWC